MDTRPRAALRESQGVGVTGAVAPSSKNPPAMVEITPAELIRRMLSLYESAPPLRHTARIESRFVWAVEDGREVTFKSLIHVADLYQELSWHDWVPETAADLAVVESL